MPGNNPLSDPDARASAPAPLDMTPAREYGGADSDTQTLRVSLDVLTAIANVQATVAALRADLTSLRADLTQHAASSQETHGAILKAIAGMQTRLPDADRARPGNGPMSSAPEDLEAQYRAALTAHRVVYDADSGIISDVSHVTTEAGAWLLMQALPPGDGGKNTAQSAVQGPTVVAKFSDVRRMWAHLIDRKMPSDQAKWTILRWLFSPPARTGYPFLPRYLLIASGRWPASDLLRIASDAGIASDPDADSKRVALYQAAVAGHPADPGAAITRYPVK